MQSILKIHITLFYLALMSSTILSAGDAIAGGRGKISPTSKGFSYSSPTVKNPIVTPRIDVSPLNENRLRITTYPQGLRGLKKVEMVDRLELEGKNHRVDMAIVPSSKNSLRVDSADEAVRQSLVQSLAGAQLPSGKLPELHLPRLRIEHLHYHETHDCGPLDPRKATTECMAYRLVQDAITKEFHLGVQSFKETGK